MRGAASSRDILILSFATMLMLGWLYYRWHQLQEADQVRAGLASVMPKIRVQIEGDVEKPGVYELPGGAIVRDLLAKVSPTLDAKSLPQQWLDMPLRDGQKVQLWKREGAPQLAIGKMDGTTMGLLLIPLNLNDATAEELAALPNVGPATAKAIVEYRQTHGPFPNLQALDEVKGIGEKTLESLQFRVIVSPPSNTMPAQAAPQPAPAPESQRTVTGNVPADLSSESAPAAPPTATPAAHP